MKLSELIKFIDHKQTSGDLSVEIGGIGTDSNKVGKGDLFVCYTGGKYDSHEFAETARANGAAALVCEKPLECDLPQIVVADGRAAVAGLARAFYGYADRKLKIVAVTGTNGKTTTTYMLKSVFDANGNKTGVIGTLGIAYGDKFIAPELTTPDPVFLHSVFADMAASGVEYVFMEVSAHALYYDKIAGLSFKAGVFTNCTQDHLDFFGTMEEYARCKKLLFREGRCEFAVVNSDDRLGAELIRTLPNAVSYGLENPADTFAVDVSLTMGGSAFVVNLFDELYDVKLCMPAMHNVYNALAAATCAKVLGVDIAVIAKGLGGLKSVTGRLERVGGYNGGEIFVDFAHTPDGLEKSLSALRPLCENKLICLFGCGGNRDRTKRPLMGAVAAKYADYIVLTSDNPRYEDPYDIIRQIEEGMSATQAKYVTVTDRETATAYAISLLTEGDVLLVAGKGGENYQEIMGIKHSYNDNTIIRNIIK